MLGAIRELLARDVLGGLSWTPFPLHSKCATWDCSTPILTVFLCSVERLLIGIAAHLVPAFVVAADVQPLSPAISNGLTPRDDRTQFSGRRPSCRDCREGNKLDIVEITGWTRSCRTYI